MDNVKKSTWIGLNDFQDTQTLTWSDKSRVTYTKWYVIYQLYFYTNKYSFVKKRLALFHAVKFHRSCECKI